jgi:acetolactate synthase I/II/III large subunit
MKTGADLIGAALAQAGATHAFGIPGGEVLALIDGLEGAGIRFILARHENAAGFMAEGLWHATGALPVLVATLGPGVANAVNVVANAQQDRVPLVFLSGCIDADIAASFTHQVFDHRAVLRPLVKASLRASPGALGGIMAKAIAIATEGQPGPVHVDVPIAVAEGEATSPPAPLPPRPAITPADDADRRRRPACSAAERPLAIAGVDAVNAGAGPAIAAFCRATGTPLVTTYKAKGLMPEDDPLAIGGAGLSPRADARAAAADRGRRLHPPARLRPDRDARGLAPPLARRPHRSSRSRPCRATTACTPCATTCAATSRRRWRGSPHRRAPWPGGEPGATRSALARAFAPGAGFGPAAIFHRLRAILPPETVATADSGAHRILFSQIWRCHAPRGLQSTGLCTMACALPLALGHRLGRARRRCSAVVGDAGLEMGLGELATAARSRPAGDRLRDGRREPRAHRDEAARRRPPLRGVTIGHRDLPALARAFGGAGAWIDDLDTLEAEARQRSPATPSPCSPAASARGPTTARSDANAARKGDAHDPSARFRRLRDTLPPGPHLPPGTRRSAPFSPMPPRPRRISPRRCGSRRISRSAMPQRGCSACCSGGPNWCRPPATACAARGRQQRARPRPTARPRMSRRWTTGSAGGPRWRRIGSTRCSNATRRTRSP